MNVMLGESDSALWLCLLTLKVHDRVLKAPEVAGMELVPTDMRAVMSSLMPS